MGGEAITAATAAAGPGSAIQQSHSLTESEVLMNTVKAIKQDTKALSAGIPQLEQLHKRALIAVDGNEASKMHHEIELHTGSMNAMAASIRTRLASLSSFKKDSRMALTQQRKQGEAFMNVMRKFKDLQSAYKKLYRDQLGRQYRIVNPEATESDIEALGENPQMLFSLANKSVAQKTLAEMRERHAEIKSLERSVADLHQLFLEVQLVVDQQGDALDRLEAQAGDTEDATTQAVTQMHSAVAKKRSAQRKKWVLLLLLIVVLGIVGLTLGLTLRHNQ